ncbi:MAG: hypothetical protein PWQ51_782 [Methanolobus sp.]|nr:hypothetical protein [Methanolobus sp.]MDK2830535.1 hypothetical protein [Methanolobus sp.]MDK2938618.1 hypothetical protein [Methanolobus sp.]
MAENENVLAIFFSGSKFYLIFDKLKINRTEPTFLFCLNGSVNMDMNELLFQENVGGFDLLIRALFGTIAIIILAMDFVEPGILQWILAIVALVGLFSSITRHCLPYSLIGFSTARK